MRLRWKFQRTIVPGQAIVIRTDGLWERRNTEGGMFGEDAFPEIIGANASAPANTILPAITHALSVGTVLGPKEKGVTACTLYLMHVIIPIAATRGIRLSIEGYWESPLLANY